MYAWPLSSTKFIVFGGRASSSLSRVRYFPLGDGVVNVSQKMSIWAAICCPPQVLLLKCVRAQRTHFREANQSALFEPDCVGSGRAGIPRSVQKNSVCSSD